MADGYSLDGYIEVPDRILAFKEKYPDGTLQGDWSLEEVGDATFVVYVARAYRTADDERPAVGMAWEWGRAIVALGFLAQGEKVASANEVRARQSNGSGSERVAPSDKQLDLIERLVKKHGGDPADVPNMVSYCGANLTGGKQGSASKLIDRLMGAEAGKTVLDLAQAAAEWSGGQEEIPADRTDLEPAATAPDSDAPF
jgi:hypothetical protein